MSLTPNRALAGAKKCWIDFMSALRGETGNVEIKQREVDAQVAVHPWQKG